MPSTYTLYCKAVGTCLTLETPPQCPTNAPHCSKRTRSCNNKENLLDGPLGYFTRPLLLHQCAPVLQAYSIRAARSGAGAVPLPDVLHRRARAHTRFGGQFEIMDAGVWPAQRSGGAGGDRLGGN